MFRGQLEIQKRGNLWEAAFDAQTPLGPFRIRAIAPSRITVLGDATFAAKMVPISAVVGSPACLIGKEMYQGMFDSRANQNSIILGRLADVSKKNRAGAEMAKDIAWVLGAMLQRELRTRQSKKPVYVPITPNPKEILRNLRKSGKRDKATKNARTIFKAMNSKKPGRAKRGLKLYLRMLKRQEIGDPRAKKTLWAISKYAEAVRERRRQEVSGYIEIGFSFGAFGKKVKSWGKKIRKLERKFRKHVTKNKALVAMIPYAGPFIVIGAEILNRVDNADPEAIKQVETIKALAGKGSPKAIAALEGLQKAQALRSALKEETKKDMGLPQSQGWQLAMALAPDKASEAQKWKKLYSGAINSAKRAGVYETPGARIEPKAWL